MPRFYRSPTWKHILTTRDPASFFQIADLSKLASSRQGVFNLGGPCTFTGTVPADDPRVTIPWDDHFSVEGWDPFYNRNLGPHGWTNLPRLNEGVRLMYSFRREAPVGGDPWVIRHAGIVLVTDDAADSNTRKTDFTVLDPWGYLYSRPCRLNSRTTPGSVPCDELGLTFLDGTTGDSIVTQLLSNTIAADGPCMIDAGVAFGGTAFYSGTIETTVTFDAPGTGEPAYSIPRGTTVGQAWADLVDTGTLDIVLTPIWDPINRPGYCAELNVYNQAPGGDTPFNTVIGGFPTFNWDRSGRSVVEIGQQMDGRERANRLWFLGGGGGSQSVYQATGLVTSASSRRRYGEYWVAETLTSSNSRARLKSLVQDELIRRRQGSRTYRLTPAPEFSPRPFQDYYLGDYCAIYHSRKLREEQWLVPQNFNNVEMFPRISGFTVDISDDQLESVSELAITLSDPTSDAPID